MTTPDWRKAPADDLITCSESTSSLCCSVLMLLWVKCSAAEASLCQLEALEVLQAVRRVGGGDEGGGGTSASLTALELLQKEDEELRSIVTFSSQLDAALGGGLPVGKMIEICGAPGVGKTQLWSDTHTHTYTHTYTQICHSEV